MEIEKRLFEGYVTLKYLPELFLKLKWRLWMCGGSFPLIKIEHFQANMNSPGIGWEFIIQWLTTRIAVKRKRRKEIKSDDSSEDDKDSVLDGHQEVEV